MYNESVAKAADGDEGRNNDIHLENCSVEDEDTSMLCFDFFVYICFLSDYLIATESL